MNIHEQKLTSILTLSFRSLKLFILLSGNCNPDVLLYINSIVGILCEFAYFVQCYVTCATFCLTTTAQLLSFVFHSGLLIDFCFLFMFGAASEG